MTTIININDNHNKMIVEIAVCVSVQLDSLNVAESWVTGVAKCPYSPRQNSTSVMTADGNFYSATVTDFTGRDAAVYRMMGPARHLRTAQYNSRWLNGT